jgi:hypothetical protein
MHAKGCALLQGSQRWGGVSGETRMARMAGWDTSSVWVQSEWGGI